MGKSGFLLALATVIAVVVDEFVVKPVAAWATAPANEEDE